MEPQNCVLYTTIYVNICSIKWRNNAKIPHLLKIHVKFWKYTNILLVTYEWCDYSKFNYSTVFWGVFQYFV